MKQNAGTWLQNRGEWVGSERANYNGQIWQIPFLLYFFHLNKKTKRSHRFLQNLRHSSPLLFTAPEAGIINIFLLLCFYFLSSFSTWFSRRLFELEFVKFVLVLLDVSENSISRVCFPGSNRVLGRSIQKDVGLISSCGSWERERVWGKWVQRR